MGLARLVTVAALLAAAPVGCGPAFDDRGNHPGSTSRPVDPQRLATSVRSVRVTTRRSPELQAACAGAARKAFVPVRCPTVRPHGPTGASVLLPRRTTLRGPDAPGDAGKYRYRTSRHLYVLDMHSSALEGGGHWIVGAGRPPDVRREVLRVMSGQLPPATTQQLLGRRVAVQTFPPYPKGGINGGHVVATATQDGLLRFASVHGHQHKDLAVSLLVSMLR